jgi:thymidylate synthase
MNKLDKDYCNLLQDILDNGVKKETRNGGTISVFGRQIRHDMKTGFPLITTKKMAFKTMVTELLWFLRGDTNIKYLVDNNCHICDGDCYQAYEKKHKHAIRTEDNRSEIAIQMLEEQLIYPKEEFINRKDPQGRDYFWLTGKFLNLDSGEDTDEFALSNGYISLVPCQYDLTAHHAISHINKEWDWSKLGD